MSNLSRTFPLSHTRIKEVARIILKEYGGDLNNLCMRAREGLLKIPGVGFKTADVFLLVVRGGNSFAVDTHISRVAKRWNIATENAGYEQI